jgi:hypothetical protein
MEQTGGELLTNIVGNPTKKEFSPCSQT